MRYLAYLFHLLKTLAVFVPGLRKRSPATGLPESPTALFERYRELELGFDRDGAAKLAGDTNIYTHVSYAPEGDKVRITASRYSRLKQYSSPLSMLAGNLAARASMPT